MNTAGNYIDYHGSKLFVPKGHFAEKALLDGFTPEGHVYNVFRENIRQGATIIDIGANIGFHTFALAALAGGNGKVFAIEADITNAGYLRASIEKSGASNIILLPIAASEKTGIIRLLHNDSTNSIFSESASKSESKVAVTARLDDVISQKIDFVKIDIEGAELLALRGMERILSEHKPAVVTEFSQYYITRTLGSDLSKEYISLFLDKGYTCSYIHPESRLVQLSDLNSILQCQQDALHNLNWGHVDLFFSCKKS